MMGRYPEYTETIGAVKVVFSGRRSCYFLGSLWCYACFPCRQNADWAPCWRSSFFFPFSSSNETTFFAFFSRFPFFLFLHLYFIFPIPFHFAARFHDLFQLPFLSPCSVLVSEYHFRLLCCFFFHPTTYLITLLSMPSRVMISNCLGSSYFGIWLCSMHRGEHSLLSMTNLLLGIIGPPLFSLPRCPFSCKHGIQFTVPPVMSSGTNSPM